MDEMRELRFVFVNRGARKERKDFFLLFSASFAVFAVNPFSCIFFRKL